MRTLINLAAVGNLMLLLAAAAILCWFFYWFGLRRVIRARRISHARERRLLREAAERESGEAELPIGES
ncbi:MAG TPA: hypothetical protein VF753_05730 [Terriglobales bacterium]